MTAFERAVALGLRAYFGSLIRTENPSTQELPSSLEWHHYGALNDYLEASLRLLFQFGYLQGNITRNWTGSQIEVAQQAQIVREEWWISDAVLGSEDVMPN